MFARFLAPTLEVQAHCDLPCGVYDPAQARIEAESIKAIIAKVADNDDPDFRTRAVTRFTATTPLGRRTTATSPSRGVAPCCTSSRSPSYSVGCMDLPRTTATPQAADGPVRGAFMARASRSRRRIPE